MIHHQKNSVDTHVVRNDIQGLRAIAVISIVIYHANPECIQGGFVGVDIFFVISGFLISSVILKDINRNDFSITNFYRRRVRRIFPALVVVLMSTVVTGFFVLPPLHYQELARTVMSTVLFVSNFDFWRTTGYFDGSASVKPLLHTWSLSVEEQFYILYPVILYVISRYAKTYLFILLSLMLVGSVILSEILIYLAPSAAYYLVPSRGFEFLVGCVVATRTLPLPRTKALRDGLSIFGLACIIVPLFLFTNQTPFPGFAALVPCLGTAIVIHVGKGATPLGSWWISNPVFYSIGNLSYSLYLWHWPILAFLRQTYGYDLDTCRSTIAISMALTVSYLSFHAVERPLLSVRLENLPFLSAGFATIIVFSACAIVITAFDGMPGRFPLRALEMFAAANDFNPRRTECHNDHPPIRPYEENCRFGAEDVPPDVAVWGDSHGAELAVALGKRAGLVGRSVMEITSSACPPSIRFVLKERPWCPEQNRITLKGLTEDAYVKTVILTLHAAGYPGTEALLRTGLSEAVRSLNTAKKRVVLVLQIPIMNNDPPYEIGMAIAFGRDPNTLGVANPIYRNSSSQWPGGFVKDLADRERVDLFDPSKRLCDANVCHEYLEGVGVLYFNHNHLTVAGAAFSFADLAADIYGGP